MLLFYIQGVVPAAKLESLYADLFKISVSEIGIALESNKNNQYQYFHYDKGEFRTMFEVFPAKNYLEMEKITIDEQVILLASHLSVALKRAVVIDGANSPSPYIWLLVEKQNYFIVEELFLEDTLDDSLTGLTINYNTKNPANFPFALRYQQKQQFIERLNNKTAEIKTLSTRRPLLAREKIELDFLQKIQAADNLETLQSIENELSTTPTDPVLIQQLLHNINEKKAFY